MTPRVTSTWQFSAIENRPRVILKVPAMRGAGFGKTKLMLLLTKLQWLNGRASVFGTEGCGFESRLE